MAVSLVMTAILFSPSVARLFWRRIDEVNSDHKESACNVGDLGWEDPLEEGMGTHSSIFAWRIPMDRGAWRATVHVITKSWTHLSD